VVFAKLRQEFTLHGIRGYHASVAAAPLPAHTFLQPIELLAASRRHPSPKQRAATKLSLSPPPPARGQPNQISLATKPAPERRCAAPATLPRPAVRAE